MVSKRQGAVQKMERVSRFGSQIVQTSVVVDGVQIFMYSIYLVPNATVDEQKEFMRQLLWRIEC